MRTINDIIPPSRRKKDETSDMRENNTENSYANNYTGNDRLSNANKNSRRRFPYTTFFATIIIIIMSVWAISYFSVAKIEVMPYTAQVSVNSSFSANNTGGSLPFKIITAQKIASQSVKSGGTKTVNSFASGDITIYNMQATAQKISANTRFATSSGSASSGLVFRIRSVITIPGGSIKNPGSISTKVYADQAGSLYNVDPSSFKLPGFAGTSKEKMVYARSSKAMTGGASGTVPVVDPTLETQTRSTLKDSLTADLAATIKKQIPSGYLFLSGSTKIVFDTKFDTPSDTSEATVSTTSGSGMFDIKEQGTITAVVFPHSALAKIIASSVKELKYKGENVSILSPDNLSLTTTTVPDTDTDTFSFTLSGNTSLFYTIDKNRIAAAISGKTRQEAEVAVSNYPEIKRAIIILRPIWRQTLPQDPSQISVIVTDTIK